MVEFLEHDLRHALERVLLDALGEADDGDARADGVTGLAHDRSEPMGRHADDDDVGAGHRLLEVRRARQRRGKREAREVIGVLVGVADGGRELRAPGPQRDVGLAAGECRGRGPPRAGSDDRDPHGATSSPQTVPAPRRWDGW